MGGSASGESTAPSSDDDCLGCRITGTATLLGVSAYFFHERRKVAHSKVGERRWLLACTSAFALAGLWRATTGVFSTHAPLDPSKQQEQTSLSRP